MSGKDNMRQFFAAPALFSFSEWLLAPLKAGL